MLGSYPLQQWVLSKGTTHHMATSRRHMPGGRESPVYSVSPASVYRRAVAVVHCRLLLQECRPSLGPTPSPVSGILCPRTRHPDTQGRVSPLIVTRVADKRKACSSSALLDQGMGTSHTMSATNGHTYLNHGLGEAASGARHSARIGGEKQAVQFGEHRGRAWFGGPRRACRSGNVR